MELFETHPVCLQGPLVMPLLKGEYAVSLISINRDNIILHLMVFEFWQSAAPDWYNNEVI